MKKGKVRKDTNFFNQEKSNIEIIDNQKEKKMKKVLAQKNTKKKEKKFSQNANLLNSGVRLFSVNSSINFMDKSKNIEQSIFEKFKIESTKENDTTHNSNKSRSYRKDKASNISNSNFNTKNVKIADDNERKSNDFEEIIVSLESTDNFEPIINYINNQEYKNSNNDKNKARADNNNIINLTKKPETFKKENSDSKENDCRNEENLELVLNSKKSLEVGFKNYENYIMNNGMENPIGDCLKSTASNFNELSHRAEKALQTCRLNQDIKYKSETTVMNKNNLSLINKTRENLTEVDNLLLDLNDFDKKKKDTSSNFDSSNINTNYDKKISDVLYSNFNSNKISNKYPVKEMLKNDLKIENLNATDNKDDKRNFNIYSNLNLSALNKLNDEIEFKNSKNLDNEISTLAKALQFNFDSPKTKIKQLISSIDKRDILINNNNEGLNIDLKSNCLHDSKALNFISKNSNFDNHISIPTNPLNNNLDNKTHFPKKNNQSNKNDYINRFSKNYNLENDLTKENNKNNISSRITVSNLNNKIKHKNLIKTEENTEIENKENINWNSLKGKIFHYQNKSLSNDNLRKATAYWNDKENQLLSKRKNLDKIPQRMSNLNKEVTFLGITQQQIMKHHKKNKINVKTKSPNSPKSSKILEIYNINEIDFSSLKNNNKIKQFSQEKEKVNSFLKYYFFDKIQSFHFNFLICKVNCNYNIL